MVKRNLLEANQRLNNEWSDQSSCWSKFFNQRQVSLEYLMTKVLEPQGYETYW